ncbi:peptidase inhibitor family I36 protein [Streptomyces sp. BP-8]|uniref:Peptidase inhibitor family I36 protein n=1 Tax=Streptomyces sirii TaxID=3127701 RepID=A0ABZ2QHV6_9ACTN
MRLQHVTAALGSLAAAAALALAATVPAHAGTGAASDPHGCPRGSVCFWPEPAFHGAMRAVSDTQRGCAATPVQPAQSIYNNGDRSRSFYSAPHCAVQVGALRPGGSVQSVSVTSWQ